MRPAGRLMAVSTLPVAPFAAKASDHQERTNNFVTQRSNGGSEAVLVHVRGAGDCGERYVASTRQTTQASLRAGAHA